MAMVVNSLHAGDTVAPDEEIAFKFAPKLTDNSELAVGVMITGNSTVFREYITNYSESDFALHSLGSLENPKFSISGDGASIAQDN